MTTLLCKRDRNVLFGGIPAEEDDGRQGRTVYTPETPAGANSRPLWKPGTKL
ncbi:MAG: hypothetical protein LBC53_08970 [Spirochaetaceae bacterium]|nr:hypothetical protein [Spirochaetaceae bacterium]